MKSKTILVLLLLCNILFQNLSAQSEKSYVDSAAYQKAIAAWEKSKAENGNSYEYSFIVEHMESTFYSKTLIIVDSGKVAKRSYYEDHDRGLGTAVEEWTEIGDEIGKHKRGQAPITMDEIYKSIKGHTLKKAGIDEKISKRKLIYYFSASEEGVIETFGSREEGCMDDCFHGISTAYFKWTNAVELQDTNRSKKKKNKKVKQK